MSVTVRHGEFEATISGDLAEQIRAALGDVGRRVHDEIHRETERIYQDAHAAWPVRTGASKASLTRRVVIQTDGQILGEVRCDAVYARYIQSWQLRAEKRSPHDARRLSALGVDPARQLAVVRQTGRARSRAAQSGSAMWLLLRWPELDAGKVLERSLGPIVSRAANARLSQ